MMMKEKDGKRSRPTSEMENNEVDSVATCKRSNLSPITISHRRNTAIALWARIDQNTDKIAIKSFTVPRARE